MIQLEVLQSFANSGSLPRFLLPVMLRVGTTLAPSRYTCSLIPLNVIWDSKRTCCGTRPRSTQMRRPWEGGPTQPGKRRPHSFKSRYVGTWAFLVSIHIVQHSAPDSPLREVFFPTPGILLPVRFVMFHSYSMQIFIIARHYRSRYSAQWLGARPFPRKRGPGRRIWPEA